MDVTIAAGSWDRSWFRKLGPGSFHNLPSFALLPPNKVRRFRRVYRLNNRSPGASLSSAPSRTLVAAGLLVRGWNHRPRLNGRSHPRVGGCIVVITHDTLNEM